MTLLKRRLCIFIMKIIYILFGIAIAYIDTDYNNTEYNNTDYEEGDYGDYGNSTYVEWLRRRFLEYYRFLKNRIWRYDSVF
mgnify:CR=1 FL=1